MGVYKADNGKIVDTDKMERVLDLDYNGCYGNVRCDLYRTKKSHQWYKVSESSWSGCGNISDAEHMTLDEIAALVMEHDADIIEDYPELASYVDQVIDV